MGSFIQRQEITARIARAFGIKSRAPVDEVSTTVVPVVLVEDLSHQDVSLEQQRPAFGQTQLTAAGGLFATFQLYNPPGSNVDVFLDMVALGGSATTEWIARIIGGSALANVDANGTAFLSTDFDGAAVAQVQNEQLAATLTPFWFRFRTAIAPSILIPLGAKLRPDTGFRVQNSAANGNGSVTFFWTEVVRAPK